MATRTTGIVRRFLSTSIFSAQSSPFSAASTAAIRAKANKQAPENDEPEIAPLTTLYISGLSRRTTAEKVQEEFSKFGRVVNVKLVMNDQTGFSKGYGFVKYANLEEAVAAKKGMDLQFIEGWRVFTEYARCVVTQGKRIVWIYPNKDDKRINDRN